MNASDRITAPMSAYEVNDQFYHMGLTDGLPIIPPTPDLVDAMVRASGHDPSEVIGHVPPLYGSATVQKIAANAVMAGCIPEYMPVVVASVAACVDEGFNLYGIQNTTHPTTPLLMVNGPIAKELKMNSGASCLGYGNRANAAIGRALRLVMINIGGGTGHATQGQPANYSFCLAECEEKSPWAPFHVDRGFSPGESTVSAFGAGGIQNMRPYPRRGRDVLAGIARMIALGGSPRSHGHALIVLNPEHARTIAADGFTKQGARDYLYENSRVRPSGFPDEVARTFIDERPLEHMDVRKIIGDIQPDTLVPTADAPENIHIIVAGGSGGHSVFIPLCFTQPTPAVTRKVGTSRAR